MSEVIYSYNGLDVVANVHEDVRGYGVIDSPTLYTVDFLTIQDSETLEPVQPWELSSLMDWQLTQEAIKNYLDN